MLSKYFKLLFCNRLFLFEKQDKTVKSTFWLFNLCNGEKKGKLGLHGGKKYRVRYLAFGLVFHFVRLRPRILIPVQSLPRCNRYNQMLSLLLFSHCCHLLTAAVTVVFIFLGKHICMGGFGNDVDVSTRFLK